MHLDTNVVDTGDFHLLDLSDNSLIPLETYFSKGSSLLLNDDVVSVVCEDIADPQDATHKSFLRDCSSNIPNDCDHFEKNSWRRPTKPVFGQRKDGSYTLYDSRLELDENTNLNPLIDGGGKKVLASTFVAETSKFDATPRPAYYCANAPQNIFNEEHCKLSFDANVCISVDVSVLNAITLNESTLQEMFRLTSRLVFAVKGRLRELV